MANLREYLKDHPIQSILAGLASLVTIIGFFISINLRTCRNKSVQSNKYDSTAKQQKYFPEMILIPKANFKLGKTEVTKFLWRIIMEGSDTTSTNGGDNDPKTEVMYSDVQIFLEKLNDKYKSNYRLPTAYEWAQAASEGKWKFKPTNNYFGGDVFWLANDLKAPNGLMGIYNDIDEFTSTMDSLNLYITMGYAPKDEIEFPPYLRSRHDNYSHLNEFYPEIRGDKKLGFRLCIDN